MKLMSHALTTMKKKLSLVALYSGLVTTVINQYLPHIERTLKAISK